MPSQIYKSMTDDVTMCSHFLLLLMAQLKYRRLIKETPDGTYLVFVSSNPCLMAGLLAISSHFHQTNDTW